MNIKDELLAKIANRSLVAGVVGLGYVGLPLAVDKALALLGNVLEPVTAKAHPEIAAIEKVMRGNGALAAGMSGSGPTVFGITRTKEQAEAIAALLVPLNLELAVTETAGRKEL